jgi:transcriptional regulator with XRE-family HTH domain
MRFGDRVRTLRMQHGLTQHVLADMLSVSVSYISKVENEKLHFGDYPSEKFIHRLAEVLKADEDHLLLLADKVPAAMRMQIRQRPELFRRIATMDNLALDALESALGSTKTQSNR